MAMMISKFHRLIQNKLTWWVVLVIIVFSFVIWGSQSSGSSSGAPRENAIAMLQDKPVELSEYQQARAGTHLGLILQYGRDINITPQIDEALREQSWQRIAALREARELGITASDDEVWAMTQQLPFFRTREGQFSMQAYDQFVNQTLPRLVGLTKHGFDQFIRDEIVLQKTGHVIARTMLVSPYDARRTYQAMNDRFVVDYALLTPDLVTNSVKTGRDEAKALFDKNPTAYKIPEMAVVRYVSIPVSSFAARVEVKDEDIQKYYNDHLDEFIVSSSNDLAKGVNTNSEFSTETTKYRDLEEVKPVIAKALQGSLASELARSNAMAFIETLQGTLGAEPLSFDDAAKKAGLPILTSKPFSEYDEVPGLNVGSDFNHAAFGLMKETGSNISEPIRGTNAWYVLAYHDRLAERIPTFEEVLDKVIPDARMQAIEDALTALAKKTRDAMDAAAAAGQSVADAAKRYGVTLKQAGPFSAGSGAEQDVEHFEQLVRGVLPHNAGEVTELLPSQAGVLVAYIKSRQPADLAAFEQLRPQIVTQIRRAQGRQLFDVWQNYLLKRGQFEDLLKRATTDEG